MHDPGPAFRALHVPGDPFVLANAWDAGSARVLAALGARAIGTSSAAHAFTLGLPDGTHVGRDAALQHASELVVATALPVSADLENGYGDDPDTVAETVRLAGEAGVAGLSIEDIALPGADAYPSALAIERIRAAVAAARALPRDLVLLARADGVMTGAYDLDEGIRRLQAFEAAGADALYLPLPPGMADIRRICASVSKPVNALAAGEFAKVPLSGFAEAGVARVSLGAALARTTHRVLIETATAILEDGDFTALANGASGVDALLGRGAGERAVSDGAASTGDPERAARKHPQHVELRRRIDGLVHRFDRTPLDGGGHGYKRRDADLWILWRPDLGWVATDPATEALTGRPWPVTPAEQSADVPPEGDWVSVKGEKSYVYELVHGRR